MDKTPVLRQVTLRSRMRTDAIEAFAARDLADGLTPVTSVYDDQKVTLVDGNTGVVLISYDGDAFIGEVSDADEMTGEIVVALR